MSDISEVDVRNRPSAEGHQLIFANFDALVVGQSYTLVHDQDPISIYNELEAKRPREFSWEYRQTPPKVWRVQIGRVALPVGS